MTFPHDTTAARNPLVEMTEYAKENNKEVWSMLRTVGLQALVSYEEAETVVYLLIFAFEAGGAWANDTRETT